MLTRFKNINIPIKLFVLSRNRNIFLYGYDVRTGQELLGHKSIETTMIYTHVIKRGGMVVRSPLDS